MRKTLRAALGTAVIIGASILGPAGTGASVASAARLSCNTVFILQDAWVPGFYPSFDPYNCELRRGDTGEAVKQLQNTMDICYREELVTDGQFGPATQAALRRVQAKAGTAADGIYGPNTRRAMLHQNTNGVTCKHVT